jgi:sugar phosphate isomerase/epimerase
LLDRLLGLAEHDRGQRVQASALVLAQLNGKDFGWAHLDVHELDHLAKFRRNAVGDKQHPNPPCLQEFFSVVRMVGYNDWVSLEMEDFTMSTEAGIRSSVDALQATISR